MKYLPLEVKQATNNQSFSS